MASFTFAETMAGSFRLSGERERPMSFTIRARSRSLGRFAARREVEIEGEVDAEGFADHRPLRGTLGMDVLATGKLPYAFDFTDNRGRAHRFVGQKVVRLRDLVGSMTNLRGALLDENGHEVGEAELRFDLRADIGRFLRSFRLVT